MKHVGYLVLSAAALGILGSIAGAAGTREHFKQTTMRETALLESCIPEACPVFYVSVLSRTFPIPNRYMLVERSKHNPLSLRFTSPVPDLSTLEAALAGKELNGTIIVEPRSELKRTQESGQIALEPLNKIDGVELYSVSIPPSSSLCCVQSRFVALVGTDDYVMIADDNERLPELLLSIARRVKEHADSRSKR